MEHTVPASRLPDEPLVRQLVVQTFGVQPLAVHRFPTGLMHYVFETTFDSREPVVVRIAGSHGHEAMRGAVQLSRLLRPRGVPLPEILAEDLDHPFPYLVLERFPGTDLGDVVESLSPDSIEAIATAVADAQRIAASLPGSTRRFGYAVTAEEAPYQDWSQLLASNLEHLQQRIVAAGIFDVREAEMLAVVLREIGRETSAIPSTPFLHDTTTKNVIVTPAGQFSGIVDVDSLCFGDPRYAVALTHASLLARGIPLHYPDAWMRVAGFAADRLFRVYVALFLMTFMAELGQRYNGNEPVTNPESVQRLRRTFLGALAQL